MTGRRVLIAVTGVISLGIVVVTGLSIVGWIGRTTEETSQRFAAQGVEIIDIEIQSGSITVVGADVDEIAMTRRSTYALSKPTYREAVAGNVLAIDARCHRVALGPCDVDYNLTVPRSVQVRAHSNSGSVLVGNIDGAVQIRSSAGSVRADDVRGDVTMSTSAGSVRGNNLTGSVVDARSSAGSVSVSFAAPPQAVIARSGAGSVTVVVPDDATTYQVTADSAAGSSTVRIRTDPAATRTIEARSSAGGVSVRYPTNG